MHQMADVMAWMLERASAPNPKFAHIVPRSLMYAFQPTLFLLGIILAGLWLGRFFVILGIVGIALIAVGYLQSEPWLRLWMAAVESGTLILGGIWLGRSGVAR